MKVLDKAICTWGFEDTRTFAIACLIEQGLTEIAQELYNNLTEVR